MKQILYLSQMQGEMRIISFIDQVDVIKKILQHLGLWEESHAHPESEPPGKNKRAYCRPILQLQAKADPPQAEANLIPSYRNRAQLLATFGS